MRVFEWDDVLVDINCTENNKQSLRLVTSKSINTEKLHSGNVHIILKYANFSEGLGEVILNNKILNIRSSGHQHTPHDYQSLNHVLRFGSNSSNLETFHGVITAARWYWSILDERYTAMEYQYAQLLFRKASRPECLCLYGFNSDSPDFCQDGTTRLGSVQSPDVSLINVHDGILDSSHRFWELPSKYVRLHLKLYEDSVVEGLTIYLGKTVPGIEVLRCVGGCDNGLSMLCYNRASCKERDENESLPITTYKLGKKLEWKSRHHTLIRKLEVVFVNPNMTDDRVYEIVIHGRALDPPFSDRQCLCFPGNGEKDDYCRDCGQCICRSGNTTNMVLAGKQCKPYLTIVQPPYGPVSGGTRLTLHGGLLIPHVKQDIEGTTVTIGNESCKVLNKTDDHITCETPKVQMDELPLMQRLKVEILVGGIFYNIKSSLFFHYRPDPVIRDVHPYKSFFGGGQVTITGKNFDSVLIRPHDGVLHVNLARAGHRRYSEKGVCKVETDEEMVCQVPSIQSKVMVEADIGLTLDGVTLYRNLSSALPEKGAFRFCLEPQFFKGVAEANSKGKERSITLQGKDITACCQERDYRVMVASKNCSITDIGPDSLSCTLMMDNGEGNEMLAIRVECLGVTFEVGYVEYIGSQENTALYALIGVIVLFLIIAMLVCGMVFYVRRRKRSKNVDTSGSMVMLDMNIKDELEGGPYLTGRNFDSSIQEIIEDNRMDFANLEIFGQIACGNFGVVFKGRLTLIQTVYEVDLKTFLDVTKASSDEVRNFLKDATIMKGFHHPNILSLMGVIEKEADIFAVFPYMANGDLQKYVTRKIFSLKTFTGYASDISNAMTYLSSQGFIHGDLAARNCRVSSTEKVLVGDFGLARDIYEKDYHQLTDTSTRLPVRWMAIERFRNKELSPKSDVWSLGITIWEIFTHGANPYHLVRNDSLRSYLEAGYRLEKPEQCPLVLFDVMLECWSEIPGERPTFEEIWHRLQQICDNTEAPKPSRRPQSLSWEGKDDARQSRRPSSKMDSPMSCHTLSSFISSSAEAFPQSEKQEPSPFTRTEDTL